MDRSYHYIGCFFPKEELLSRTEHISEGHLFRLIDAPHVTFVFAPEKADESLFGEKVRVRVTGYGNDGRNEGLRVELYSDNRELCDMIVDIPVPHITLSVAKGARPYETRFLEFQPIEPLYLEGTFGGYTEGGTVVCGRPESR